MRLRLLAIPLIAVFALGSAAGAAAKRPGDAFASRQNAAPPTCIPSTVVTVPGVAVAVQIDCVDAGLNPTVTVVTAPVGGTLIGLPGQYVPSAGFNGTDHIGYTVTNTATGETSAETAINVVVNSKPACADGTATTRVGTPLKLSFPCTDPDGGPVLIRAEDGRHGTVDPHVGSELTYTPDPGYVGTDEISFVGMDGAYLTTPRTLTITITAPPAATATPAATTPVSSTPVPSTPPASTPVADKTAPAVSAKAGTARIASGVTLTLKASEAGTLKLTLTAGKTTSTKITTLAGGTSKLTLKLSAKARKALKHKKRVKATLTIVATDAAGNRTTKRLSVTLKR
jgi:hypothetical protein